MMTKVDRYMLADQIPDAELVRSGIPIDAEPECFEDIERNKGAAVSCPWCGHEDVNKCPCSILVLEHDGS